MKTQPTEPTAVVISRDPEQIATAAKAARSLSDQGYAVSVLATPAIADRFAGQLFACLENECCGRLPCQMLSAGGHRTAPGKQRKPQMDRAALLLQSASVILPF
ncbi:MAG: hypothetical protein LJE65_07970 [Desulfobacteraceae bacterium]|jgi:hypothetical protein|nr:hypothetical protein [Desulfobacteraceae bacterium]